MKICPIHNRHMYQTQTKYGLRWGCGAEGCTVACWDGATSTPADAETRALRKQGHEMFDPLWRRGEGSPFLGTPGGKQARRHRAYDWLAQAVGVQRKQTHFGLFTAEQCRKAMKAMEELTQGRTHMDITADTGTQEQFDRGPFSFEQHAAKLKVTVKGVLLSELQPGECFFRGEDRGKLGDAPMYVRGSNDDLRPIPANTHPHESFKISGADQGRMWMADQIVVRVRPIQLLFEALDVVEIPGVGRVVDTPPGA